MKPAQILLLCLVIGLTLSKISPGAGIPNSFILEEDVYSVDYRSAFDLSKVSDSFNFSTDKGRVIGVHDPIQTRHFTEFGVKKLELIKYITNTLAIFVYDGSKTIIQELDHNGKLFLKSHFQDFTTGLKKLRCTGFAMNTKRNLLYVGCNEVQTTQPGIVTIATYDLATFAISSRDIQVQSDGFKILNRLEMFITKSPQESNEEDYLIVYDQGRPIQQERREGNKFRVYRNVATRKLTFYILGNVEIKGREDLNIVYDIFPYQDTILVTGRYQATKNGIFLAECNLNNADALITCLYSTIKLTGVAEGHISILNESRYIEADTAKKTLTVNTLSGAFKDPSWKKKTLDKLEKVTFFEDDNVWIRGVSLCEYGAALNYDNNIQHQEYGFMAFDFITGNYVHIKGATGAVWEKNIITGENDNDEVILSRVELGEVMVEGFTLTPGANKITLTARDTDGSETTEGTITLMDNLFDDVKINSIADVTVKSGQTVRLPINSQTIESGNDLSIEAVSSDESVLKVKDAYHTQQLDIEWSEEVTGDYFFDGQRAVVEILSPSKQLLFSDCHRSSGAKVECEIYQKYVVSTGHVAQNKIFDLGATTLAYTVNAKTDRTHIIIANKDEVYVRTLKYG